MAIIFISIFALVSLSVGLIFYLASHIPDTYSFWYECQAEDTVSASVNADKLSPVILWPRQ